MKEYDHCSTNREFIYNNMLRIAKNLIECVFCRLKVRWPLLTRKMDIKLENVSAVIYACFVFYNFCEKHDLYVDKNQVKIQIGTMRQKEKDQCPVNFLVSSNAAVLAQYFYSAETTVLYLYIAFI